MVDSKVKREMHVLDGGWRNRSRSPVHRACRYSQSEPRHFLLDISIRLTKIKGIEWFSALFYTLVEGRGRIGNSVRFGNCPKVKRRKI